MKKKLKMLSLISVLAIGASLVFTACGNDEVAEHDHVYDEGTVTTEATCYQEGVKTYTCTVAGCGQTKTAPISMIAHSWDEGEVTKPAKCNEAGVKTYTCTVDGCGQTKEEPIEKTAHRWDDGVVTKTPDLLTSGTRTLTCLDCNTQKTESIEARADFSEQFYTTLTESNDWLYGYANAFDAQTGEVDFVRITETESNVWEAEKIQLGKGYIYSENIAVIAYAFRQELPQATQTDIAVSFVGEESATRLNAYLIVNGESIELNGDNAKDWNYQTEEAVDIAKDDTVYLVFENVGEGKAGGNLSFRFTVPCAHVWDSGKVIKEATCSADGVKEYSCALCDKTYTEAMTERTDHSFTGDWLIGENGHYKKCDNCDYATQETAHDYSTEVTEKRIDATCNSDGVQYFACECGDEITVPVTQRPDHDFTGAWVNTSADGHYRVCKNCGEADTTVAHSWVDVEEITPATNDEDGVMKTECSVCGYESTRVIPAFKHVQGAGYGKDADNHWFLCSEHEDCGTRFEETPHNFTEHLIDEDKAATCQEDGYTVWQCVCGEKEIRIVSRDTVPHDYEGQPFISDNAETHHQNCKVCGEAGESVGHAFVDGEVMTPATFWEEGEATRICECGATTTVSVAKIDEINHADEFTVENQDGNWEYGRIDMQDWDNIENNPKMQATEINEGSDGWITGEYSSIKNGWMSASDAVYIAFKAEEAVTIKVEIVVTRLDGMKRLDVRTASDDESEAKYHGDYDENGVMTVTETYTLSAGSKLYMIFTQKGEDSGFEQAEYSITITRV